MARILGLDLGAHSVKALLLESSFRGVAVRSYTEQKRTDEGGLAAALAALKEAKHLTADQVVVAVPGLSVATQLVTLPFTDARRVDATIGFEVEGLLPYDLDEVVFDYQILEAKDGKSQVLVGTARKDELRALFAALAEVGVDPRVVTTSALVYQNLLATGLGAAAAKAAAALPAPVAPVAPVAAEAATGTDGAPAAAPAEPPPPVETVDAVIDLGHERTAVCIGRLKGGIEYARTFAGGGRDLTRAIAAEFSVSLADAQAWKENEGDIALPEGAPAETERAALALRRGMAPVLREIRGTLRAHFARFHKPLARVWIAGGTARLKGMDAWLSQELGVEVLRLEAIPREATSPVNVAEEAVATQAYALAMRGHGSTRAARFNLRKGEFAFKGDLDYLKGKTSRLGAFAAILALLALVSVWAQFRALSSRESTLDKILCENTTRVLGSCQKDYLVALSMLKGKSSPTAALPQLSALDLFAELTSRTQNAKVKLGEAEVNLDRIRLRGETDNFDGVDQLVGVLKGYRCFQEIKRGKVQRTRDGSKVEFDLDILVQCPEAGREGV